MHLFEAVNGDTGSSYCRCYIWADSIRKARFMVNQKYPEASKYRLKRLLSDSDEPFVTNMSSEGWDK